MANALALALHACARRLPIGYELMFARSNQISAAHGFERLAQKRPIFCIMIAQKGLMQPPLAQTMHAFYRL
jgi:hypothetical protein